METEVIVENHSVTGLMDLIAEAMSVSEIDDLVNKGKTEYKNASYKTIRRWNSVAARRISELNTSDISDDTSNIKLEKKKMNKK